MKKVKKVVGRISLFLLMAAFVVASPLFSQGDVYASCAYTAPCHYRLSDTCQG